MNTLEKYFSQISIVTFLNVSFAIIRQWLHTYSNLHAWNQKVAKYRTVKVNIRKGNVKGKLYHTSVSKTFWTDVKKHIKTSQITRYLRKINIIAEFLLSKYLFLKMVKSCIFVFVTQYRPNFWPSNHYRARTKKL